MLPIVRARRAMALGPPIGIATGFMQQFTITQPDDWHVHLRDGDYLRTTVPHLAREFRRAIVMPNLKPPVVTAAQAAAYRDRILAALPAGLAFEPQMTLYLTVNTPSAEIRRARIPLAGLSRVRSDRPGGCAAVMRRRCGARCCGASRRRRCGANGWCCPTAISSISTGRASAAPSW